MAPLLEVTDLWVEFDRPDGTVHAVNGVTFSLEAGESLGIVGESGCGKTVSLLAILGLLTSNGRVVRGEAYLGQIGLVRGLLQMSRRDLFQVRSRAVMYLGAIMEMAPAEGLFRTPAHPYTRALMTSVLRMPRPGQPPARVKPLGGEVPSAVSPPPGCPFHTRCPEAIERCYKEIPELRAIAPEHQVACHLA